MMKKPLIQIGEKIWIDAGDISSICLHEKDDPIEGNKPRVVISTKRGQTICIMKDLTADAQQLAKDIAEEVNYQRSKR